MKRGMFLILALFFMLPLHKSQAASVYPVSVPIGIGVEVANNTVTSICVGRHGTFLTKSEILQYFDINRDGVVTVAEFESKKNTMNWTPFLPRPVEIRSNDPERLLTYMDNAKRYMASLNFHFYPPRRIIVGSNSGSYGNNVEWVLEYIDYEIVISKVIQSALLCAYGNLDYTALEAFARYFIYSLLAVKRIQGRWIYNAGYEQLTGSDIFRAYQDYNAHRISEAELQLIIQKTSNNNLALAQAMLEIRDAMHYPALTDWMVLNTLYLLKNLSQQKGYMILKAFMGAAQARGLIESRFNSHGIYRPN